MKSVENTRSLGLLWISIAIFASSAQAKCKLELLEPQASTVRVGAIQVSLGEADDLASPTAWQGPLVAGTCKVDLGLIEKPLALTNDRLVFVPTYSGSTRQLTLLDLESCTARWKSAIFAGELHIGEDELNLGTQRIALDAKCIPVIVRN